MHWDLYWFRLPKLGMIPYVISWTGCIWTYTYQYVIRSQLVVGLQSSSTTSLTPCQHFEAEEKNGSIPVQWKSWRSGVFQQCFSAQKFVEVDFWTGWIWTSRSKFRSKICLIFWYSKRNKHGFTSSTIPGDNVFVQWSASLKGNL